MSRSQLEAVLGTVPDGIAELDESRATELARLVGRAIDDQSRALDEAIDAGLRHVPRPLRGVVRRTLFR